MNDWIMGGAALGVIGACWEHIKAVFGKIYSLFIVTVTLDSEELKRAVALYCWRNLWRSPYGERRYGSYHLYVRTRERYMDVAHEKIGTDPIIFWKGWRPLFLGDVEPKESDFDKKGRLTFIRGTWDIDKLLQDAMELYNSRVADLREVTEEDENGRRFVVYQMCGDPEGVFSISKSKGHRRGDGDAWAEEYRLGDTRIVGYSPADLGPRLFNSTDPRDRLAFSPWVWKLTEEVRHWKESRAWYVARDIPWKRGWAIYGPPGNGKSSLVRAVAEMLDLPVYTYRLGTFTDEQFREAWKYMISRAPCIALIEDIDNVFHGRTNIQKSDMFRQLSFDCFLNTLDGVDDGDGVFTIITTNHIEQLDPALARPSGGEMGASSRPGRIDRVIELGKPDETARHHIAKRILADCPWTIKVAVSAGTEDSAAQFQERCIRIALADHWEKCGVDMTDTKESEREAYHEQFESETRIQANAQEETGKCCLKSERRAIAIPA